MALDADVLYEDQNARISISSRALLRDRIR